MSDWYEKPEWSEVGVEAGRGPVPEGLPLEWFRRRCEEDEKLLRLQDEDGRLAPEDELALQQIGKEGAEALLRRWKYLGHLFLKRSQKLSRAGGEDAMRAAFQLLSREAIKVDIGTRVVEVTDRSYAAIVQIARHQLRMMELEQALERSEAVEGRLLELFRGRPERRRTSRRRLSRLYRHRRELVEELSLHRQAIYAHAFTPDGAPARSLDEAPDWWAEVTPRADMLLLLAIRQAGAGRVAELGDPPDPPEGQRRERPEDFGWMSVLADWDRRMKPEAAPYINRPLGQAVASMRAGAEPFLEDME